MELRRFLNKNRQKLIVGVTIISHDKDFIEDTLLLFLLAEEMKKRLIEAMKMFQMLREFIKNESGANAINVSLMAALLSVTLVAILAA